MEPFFQCLQARSRATQSVLCVGLDTAPSRTPEPLKTDVQSQLFWNRGLIDATYELACCYKPNLAFYLIHGSKGLATLKETIAYAHQYDVPVIVDAKFGDIGHTAEYYAKAVFEFLDADAVTVNPYMGKETILPFAQYANRGCFILCLTSNVSRSDFQMVPIANNNGEEKALYHLVAENIREWNKNRNLGAVAGATAPEELSQIRECLGRDVPILCPGVGTQGGDLEEVLWAGYSGPGSLLINVSRAIINASAGSDFAEAARREAEMFVNQIRAFLEQYGEGS